jgi:hypothetical protein
MCETCARKLLEMAKAMMPVPDEMGAANKSLAARTLREAAEIIRRLPGAAGRGEVSMPEPAGAPRVDLTGVHPSYRK